MQRDAKIEKRDGKWRVGEIKVKADDDITWSCNDSDFAVWFPPGRDPLDTAPGNPRGRQQKRKVKKDAAKGVYEYALFCYVDNTMAEGDSYPKMIIE